MTYNNAVKYLMSLPENSISDGSALERMKTICKSLNNPDKKLKYIHICGNVGKNSCLQMIRSILRKAKLSVGCFNPFETDVRKSISVNGDYIYHEKFAGYIKLISQKYSEFFPEVAIERIEILCLAAIAYFSESKCDIAIFEKTEQKYDVSNITDAPLVSVITPLSAENAENTDYLDGIIKKGTSETVSAPQHKDIYNMISDACAFVGSRLTVPIYSELEINKISMFKTLFTYRGYDYCIRSFSPCQSMNAITAIESARALKRVGVPIEDEDISQGLDDASFLSKCQAISMNPSVVISTTYQQERLETVFASLAQIKEFIKKGVFVFIDTNTGIDTELVQSYLSSFEISCAQCIEISESDNGNTVDFEKAIKNYAKSLNKQDAMDSFTLFIGKESFIRKVKEIIQLNLGN